MKAKKFWGLHRKKTASSSCSIARKVEGSERNASSLTTA